MRALLALSAVLLALGATAPIAAAQDPVIQIEFTNRQLDPWHWVLTLHPGGSGHFRSEMGMQPAGQPQQIDTPDVNRDVHLSAAFAAHVFDIARRHNWFNEECESHLKVAFQGWKKFSYRGPGGVGTCTFNYSKDKEIEELGDSLQAVAQTILEGERLEMLLQHDRLGLDKETEYLVDAAESGRVQQLCAIRQILVQLAQDDEVLERVRKRARLLLAQAGT